MQPGQKLSSEHREAITRGIRQRQALVPYLDTISGGYVTVSGPETVVVKLERIQDKLTETPDPLLKLSLIQKKIDLLREYECATAMQKYEGEFASTVADYSGRKGISYWAWREVGVPAQVLRKAGMKRAGCH